MKKSLLDKTIRPINKFIHYDNSGGIALFLAVNLALVWANSPWKDIYHLIWHTYFSIGLENNPLTYSLHHWVNDGLMAMFFLAGLFAVWSPCLHRWRAGGVYHSCQTKGQRIPFLEVYQSFALSI